MIGHIEDIVEIITALKANGLAPNIMEELQDYFSCKVPLYLVKKLGNDVKNIQSYKIPGMSKFLIITSVKETAGIEEDT